MSAITDAREHLATVVADGTGVTAHAFMPDRLTPPAVIVLPGTPYLAASGTFGSFTLGLDVVVVTDAKVNASGAQTLDALLDDAVVDLVNDGIGVSEVSEPWSMTFGNATYLASTITTQQPVHL